MSTFYFKNAVADYRLLKNSQYPAKASLKLVGDRYRLTKLQRNCLLRGVVEKSLCLKRTEKNIQPEAVRGKMLGIDWFNVLITVESYLKGALLFLSDDGIVRDSSSIHGSYRQSELTTRAIGAILHTIRLLVPRHIDIYMDSPISHSKQMHDELGSILMSAECPFSYSISLAQSADYPLKTYPGIVASSDSVIIDRVRFFIDLPSIILENHFSFRAVSLDEINIF
jgi:hypothetical protein